MSKKNIKGNLFPIIVGCSALLAIVALIMPAAPFVTSDPIFGETYTVKGFDLIFGDYSVGGVLFAWIWILVGAIFLLCGLVAHFLKKAKIASLAIALGGALLIVGSIMYFCVIQSVSLDSSDVFGLGIGAIIGGILGLVGGVASLGLGCRELLR